MVVLATILIPFAVWGERMERLSTAALSNRQQDWTALVVVLLLAVDVFLPIPSSLVSAAAGAALGWSAGTAASMVGMTAASLVAYGLGHAAGRPCITRWVGATEMARFDRLFSRVGAWAIVLARPVPVLAESSAFLSGSNAYPIGRFVLLSAAANLAISAIYAAIGAGLTTMFSR
jgi:uncharacterized membrane protein YdjX (TVP38/TMEM64 family)